MGIFKSRPTPADTGMLYRQLAIMIGSGVPVSEAIQILAQESESNALRKMTLSISGELKSGKGLHESLAKYPRVFNDAVLTLLHHLEDSKKVSRALHELADATEDDGIIRTRFLQALYIPIIELIIGILILAFISLFVIPIFEDMFSSMGSNLPLPTLVVVRVGGWIGEHFLYLLIALSLLLVFVLKSNFAAAVLATLIPGLNRLTRQLSLMHFTSHLGMMAAFDMPLGDAVSRAALTLRHPKHARRLLDAATKVTDTSQLEAALASSGLFAKSILRMITYGAKSETLSEVMQRISNFYRREFNRRMARIFPRLQICGTLIVGIIMGLIIIALYLPIFKMAGGI